MIGSYAPRLTRGFSCKQKRNLLRQTVPPEQIPFILRYVVLADLFLLSDVQMDLRKRFFRFLLCFFQGVALSDELSYAVVGA